MAKWDSTKLLIMDPICGESLRVTSAPETGDQRLPQTHPIDAEALFPSGPTIGDPSAPTKRPGATSASSQLTAGAASAAAALVANDRERTGTVATTAVATARRVTEAPIRAVWRMSIVSAECSMMDNGLCSPSTSPAAVLNPILDEDEAELAPSTCRCSM